MASRLRRVLLWCAGGLAVLGVVWGVLALVFDVIHFRPDTQAMWPNFGAGAIVLVNRRATPERGDVVVIAKEEGGYMLSRVVALPGESFAFFDLRPRVEGVPVEWQPVGHTYINNRAADVIRETLDGRSYLILDLVTRNVMSMFARKLTGYWVLEDNREDVNSKDSRNFGEVARSRIRGVVVWVMRPGDVPPILPLAPTPDAGAP